MRLPMTMVVLEHVIKDLKNSERNQGLSQNCSCFPKEKHISIHERYIYLDEWLTFMIKVYIYTCKHTSPMDAMVMDRITLNRFGPELSQTFNPPGLRDYCSVIDVYKCMDTLFSRDFFSKNSLNGYALLKFLYIFTRNRVGEILLDF